MEKEPRDSFLLYEGEMIEEKESKLNQNNLKMWKALKPLTRKRLKLGLLSYIYLENQSKNKNLKLRRKKKKKEKEPFLGIALFF